MIYTRKQAVDATRIFVRHLETCYKHDTTHTANEHNSIIQPVFERGESRILMNTIGTISNKKTFESLFYEDKVALIGLLKRFDTCYEKTLRAFTFFRPTFSKYDFIFRTNLSSFIVLDRYVNLVKQWPRTNFCSAFIGTIKEGLQFPSGAGFTITPDLVERLLDEQPPLFVQDDVTIGYSLDKWNIPIHSVHRTDILLNEQVDMIHEYIKQSDNIFHYRLKNIHGNRDIDVKVMKLLLEYHYHT